MTKRNLETAENAKNLKRVSIDPVTRVEGHGRVTLLLDEAGKIHQVRLHIVEFRGFEKFIQGHPYWEVPVLVQRLCGICPVSHHLAAGKAIDMLVGARQLTPTAEKLRRLMHVGQMLQSHALHFFHLASPDLLFGFDDDVVHRNVVGVIAAHPDLAVQGVKLRKFGQQVIEHIAGKRIHGTAALPGGMNKPLSAASRESMLQEIGQIIEWSRGAVALTRKVFESSEEHSKNFAVFRSNFLGLIGPGGELEFYDGGLRARDADGGMIFDQIDATHYNRYIREEVKSWSYMKFPFLISLGADDGWYRVGPLARVNNCDRISTPLAEAERLAFRSYAAGMQHATLAYHWARMIEMLHAAEEIERLLNDPDILGTDLMAPPGQRLAEGIGVIEAPRGTLFHHYRVNEDDVVEKANLIVSTTNNNQAMNEAIRSVAARYLDGRSLTEGMLNRIEVAIRAYDPCLSCATHALGKMPLTVDLVDPDGTLVDRMVRDGEGSIVCSPSDG